MWRLRGNKKIFIQISYVSESAWLMILIFFNEIVKEIDSRIAEFPQVFPMPGQSPKYIGAMEVNGTHNMLNIQSN